VPPALEYVIGRCLTKDPEQRMQTAWDLLCQLRWIAGRRNGIRNAQADWRRTPAGVDDRIAALALRGLLVCRL
jgi:hypothetical protein